MKVELFGDWSGSDLDRLESDFETTKGHFDGDHVVGWYSYENYDGSARGFVRRGDEWFEFSGGHCSCNGLEGQGALSPVTREYVANLPLSNISYPEYPKDFADAVKAMVKS